MDSPQNTHEFQHTESVCAVIVTHNPDEKVSGLLKTLQNQTTKVIIVDNGSQGTSKTLFEELKYSPEVEIIENPDNLGIAVALNQGLKHAMGQGYEWMVTFDQDSQPESDLLQKLISAQMEIERKNIAIIAPQIIDARLEKPSLFLQRKMPLIYERVPCNATSLEDITYVITSGAMVNTNIAEALGGFRSDLFIDYVDTEFCLRARKHGYRILVACEAKIHHYFGERKHIRWGPVDFYPSFHSPERWYTMSRNRVPMIMTYGLKFPHWLTYEIVATGYILLRMLLTEDRKGAKLNQFLRGTWDGLRGRMGSPYWAKEEK